MRQINLLLTLILLIAAEAASYDDYEKTLSHQHDYHLIPNELHDENIRHISSMMNAYRSYVMGGRLPIDTDAQVDTSRYRAWKRHADYLTTILELPKGMDEAGR